MQTIDAQELKRKIDANEDFVFLNVLSREYFDKEHIPGSDNIPYDSEDFVQKVEERAGGKETEIVVYCANTECTASPKAAEKLEDAGFTNVIDFEGGMEEWKDAEYAVAA